MAGIVDKLQKMWNPPDDEYDEYYDEAPVSSAGYDDGGEVAAPRRTPFSTGSSNRVVSISSRTPSQMIVFQPVSYSGDTQNIAEHINQKYIVVLNFQNTQKDETRRILDFLCGVAMANGGKPHCISKGTFVITPANVDLSGDELRGELENNGIYF